MIKELSNVDYEFFFRLSSLYHALVSSSVDPIAVPSSPETIGKTHIFSHQFWDAHENEKYALTIMQERIQQCPDDIRQHQKYHESMRDAFFLINESVPENDRELITKNSKTLFDALEKYKGLVNVHEQNRAEKFFLYYPTCFRGHYFDVKGDNRVRENCFNYRKNKLGLEVEIKFMRDLLPNFSIRSDNISHVKITHEFDSGRGFSDSSLRGRIELNKELLKRAGFKI